MTVGSQIDEAIVVSEGRRANVAARRRELLRQIGLNHELAGRYPHELSGGQRQRVVIGRALAAKPALLVCDEPLAALDVSVQAQMLALFQELRNSFSLSFLFISHQLSTVRYLCDEVAVMYAGRLVELGTTEQVLEHPRHPYTRMLLSTMLDPRGRRDSSQKVVGEPPNPLSLPSGCPFHPRCNLMQPDPCAKRCPEIRPLSNGSRAACHFAGA